MDTHQDDPFSGLVNEDDPMDIFSRESQLIRRNSKSMVAPGNSSGSAVGRNSSLRRNKKPAGVASPPPGSADEDSTMSPSHVSCTYG